VCDSGRTLNVDENRFARRIFFCGGSFQAALQQSAVHHRVDTGGRGRCSAIGEVVDVALFNPSITYQKVL